MKQRIDHSNYEAWLMDRLEGRLSPDQERELAAFLLAHPELDSSIEDLPTLRIDSDELDAREKERLKRSLPPQGLVNERTVMDFLIARHEGDLTSQQEEALAAYLLAHPEHAGAERLVAAARVPKDGTVHPDTDSLHRALPPTGLPVLGDLDDFLVARMEGDLSDEQERAIAAILAADDEARRAWTMMQATRTPHEAVLYPDKAALKRGTKVIPIARKGWVMRMAAAAAVLLLIGISWWWLLGPSTHEEGFAGRTSAPALKQEAHTVERTSESQRQESGLANRAEEAQLPEPHEQRPLPERTSDTATHHQSIPSLDSESSPLEQAVAQDPHDPVDTTSLQLRMVPDQMEQEPVAMIEAPMQEEAVPERVTPNLRQALTGALRERVLDRPADVRRSLDDADAEAAAHRAVRAVAGQHAGFTLSRDAQGRSRGFKLKLGRHVAVSARR